MITKTVLQEINYLDSENDLKFSRNLSALFLGQFAIENGIK